MTVPYILFVEAILGSFEFIFLNHHFFFINVLRVFQRLLRMLVNVSQWCMEIGNFNNSISNSLRDYVFCPSKSLTVIAYLLYAVLFKHIVNWTLVLANFNAFFRAKIFFFNIRTYSLLQHFIFIHVEHLVLQVFATAEWC